MLHVDGRRGEPTWGRRKRWCGMSNFWRAFKTSPFKLTRQENLFLKVLLSNGKKAWKSSLDFSHCVRRLSLNQFLHITWLTHHGYCPLSELSGDINSNGITVTRMHWRLWAKSCPRNCITHLVIVIQQQLEVRGVSLNTGWCIIPAAGWVIGSDSTAWS